MHHLKTKGNTDFAGTNTYVFNKSLNPGLEILCVLLFYSFYFNLTPPKKGPVTADGFLKRQEHYRNLPLGPRFFPGWQQDCRAPLWQKPAPLQRMAQAEHTAEVNQD